MKSKIKSFFKEVLLGVIALVIIANVISYFRKPHLDSTLLPKIEVTLIDGKKFTPQTNKPLMLHFWATWCPTCRTEAQNIQSVSQKYEVLSVVVKSGNNKELINYMQKNSLNFRVLNDENGKWARQFKIKAFPTTFIYNKKHHLEFSEVGYTTTLGLLGRMRLLSITSPNP